MQRLVLDRPRQADIAPGADHEIVRAAEDRLQDRGRRRQVDQRRPLRQVQQFARGRGGAVAVAVRQPPGLSQVLAPAGPRLGQEIAQHPRARLAHRAQHRPVQQVADDHEAIAQEHPGGPLGFPRFEDVEAGDAVGRPQVLAQRANLGIVEHSPERRGRVGGAHRTHVIV